MKKSFKCAISLLLAALMLSAVLAACGNGSQVGEEKVSIEPMNEDPVYALSFDFLGGNDVMPITAYYGPRLSTYSKNGEALPEMINDQYYEMIQECGVNLIFYSPTNYEYTPEYIIEMLKLGEKYDIGHIVTDTKISSGAVTGTEAAARINEYANYPSFCGVHVVDEPYLKGIIGNGTHDMSEFVPVFDLLKSLGITAVSNLLPSKSFSSDENFEIYVQEFVDTCDAPYICFDYYVFDKRLNVTDYFYNLSVYREAAEKMEVPMWVCIQAGSQWNDSQKRFDSETPYFPNEKQFDWNINTSLAYGAKGLVYFPLIQPSWFAWAESTEFDFQRNGLIGAWGNKTQWFYYAKDIQPHIAAVDEVLMNAVNKGVLVSGQQAIDENTRSECILEGTSWRELANISGDAMVGCFNYQGKTALYVVNYDREYAQHINLTFHDTYKFSVIQDAQKSYYSGSQIELTMQAGEGVLIVFEQ